MEELKLCPLCGSEAHMFWGDCHNIQCSGCNIGFRGEGGMTKEAVILAWNNNGKIPERTHEWIDVTDCLPPLETPVRIWHGECYMEDFNREVVGRRVKTNNHGDWFWYAYDHNSMLHHVTHWAYQIAPQGYES